MKYRVLTVMSYWQSVEIEADNPDDAANKAYEGFDVTKASRGDGETYKIELIEGNTE